MIAGLDKINSAHDATAEAMFTDCCGSSNWAKSMTAARPFLTIESLLEKAAEIWRKLDAKDRLEAFSRHPKIGGKKAASQQAKQSAEWSQGEQSGVANADESAIDALAEINRLYFEKFGFIYIVCATGKTAGEMLALCEARLKNEADLEIIIAAEEQNKITRIRLRKLLESAIL